jgi:2'-5' RNA ligase
MQKGDLRREFTVHVMLSDQASVEIDQLIDQSQYPDWDWKNSDDRHITMAKLGILYPPELDKVKDVLARVANQNKPFVMSFDSPVSFDKRMVADGRKSKKKINPQEFPFVLWMRPDPRGWTRLSGLFKNMAGCLGRAGFSYGYAPARFQAHTTVARARKDQEQAVMDYIDTWRNWKGGDFKVEGFALREFYPRNHPAHPDNNNGQGSRFHTIKTYHLSGN